MKLRDHFKWGVRTYIMGILNVTPDSFSGDGLAQAGGDVVPVAVAQALQLVADGADILDVGGESTRPGAVAVGADEELARVIPVISALAAETDIPISIDTYKAKVAAAALEAGASIVNDVWGLRMDPEMAGLVAARRAPVVLTHNRSRPRDAVQEARLGGRYVGAKYDDLLGDVTRELQASIALAHAAGVADEQIILDPGIGFGKTVEQNLELTRRLAHFTRLGYPLLYGSSRKSFIGYTLDLPPGERAAGTAATVAIAIEHGADIVRVHDVRMIARVARMTDAIVRG